jgi:hypothetical protein
MSKRFIFSLRSKQNGKFFENLKRFQMYYFTFYFFLLFPACAIVLSKLSFCEGASAISYLPELCKNTRARVLFNIYLDGNIHEWFSILGPRDFTPGTNFEKVRYAFFSGIIGGNIYHKIFILIWFTACAYYTFFISVLRDEQELKSMFDEPLEEEKQSKFYRIIEEIYLFLPTPIFLTLFSLLVFITFHEFRFLVSSNTGNDDITIHMILMLVALKVTFVIFALLAPLIPGYIIKRDFKKEETWLMVDALSKQFETFEDILSKEESLILEFKTSFQSPYPAEPSKLKDENNKTYYSLGNQIRYKSIKEIEKMLQDMVLEAIVGFLNSSGGILVIGINEKDNQKKVVGIEFEGFKSLDAYERHIIQIIINRIGISYMGTYISTEFMNAEDKNLFIINVKPFHPKAGQIPALLDGKSCFKRTGPRTDKIKDGIDFAEFVAQRLSEN